MTGKTIIPLVLIIISLAGITASLNLIKSSRDVRQLAQTAASPSPLPLPALRNIPSLTANAPPGAEYTISSDNNNVKVVLDKKYGGAITKLYDFANSGSNNIVNNSQAGAMFQTAFWLEPIQNFNPPYVGNNPRLAPFCSENDTSMWWNNPTQAGFEGDGWAGNPIGIMGTNGSVPDPKEFIQYENSGKTVHFKSRFINFGFCFEGIGAPIHEANCDALSPTGECKYFWDTGFYIEQWVSFHPKYPRTLQISSKITFEESKTYEQDPVRGLRRLMSSRQLPVYFAYRLPRGVYFKDGLQIKTPPFGETFSPDYKWMALLQRNKEAGVGYVPPKNMVQMTPPPHPLGFSSLTHDGPDGDYVTVMANNNVPDLTTMGVLNNVTRYQDTVFFQFNPAGSFEWTSFFPVGTLPDIFWQAEAVHSPENFSKSIGGFVDRFTCDQPDIAGWVRDENTPSDLTAKVEIAPVNNPANIVSRLAVAGNYRPDLTAVCPPDGKCAYSVQIGSLPASFQDKKLKVKVYGVAPDGTSRNIVYHTISNIIGPCNSLIPVASPTPTPIPSPSPSPTPCAVPSPPSNLNPRVNQSCGLTSMTFSWDSVPGAEAYYLRINDESNPWDEGCNVQPGDTCTTISGTSYTRSIIPGVSYYWWVHAANSCGLSDPTGARFTSPICPTPTPPPPSPSPAFTVNDLKTLLLNFLGGNDANYKPTEGKVNLMDAGWVLKWLIL